MAHKALDLRVYEISEPFQIFFRQTASDMRCLAVGSDDQRVFKVVAVVNDVNILQLFRSDQEAD